MCHPDLQQERLGCPKEEQPCRCRHGCLQTGANACHTGGCPGALEHACPPVESSLMLSAAQCSSGSAYKYIEIFLPAVQNTRLKLSLAGLLQKGSCSTCRTCLSLATRHGLSTGGCLFAPCNHANGLLCSVEHPLRMQMSTPVTARRQLAGQAVQCKQRCAAPARRTVTVFAAENDDDTPKFSFRPNQRAVSFCSLLDPLRLRSCMDSRLLFEHVMASC